VRITTVIENTLTDDSNGLTAEHGLSLHISVNRKTVLFDTRASDYSHNGALNMIDTVAKKIDGIPIKAVIGGFHLIDLPKRNTMAESKSEIRNIARKMLDYPVQTIYTGHCTGQKAYAVLKSMLGEKLQHFHTGAILEI